MFFAIEPTNAVISDLNFELINCYTQIKDTPEEVIKHLESLINSEDDYYRIRQLYPILKPERAARLIYLVVLSFNGIYRLNQQGSFNVPYGYRTHVNPCDAEKIKAVSGTLAKATLLTDDFEATICDAKKGDLIYLDPPYTVAHQNNGFLKYNDKIFSWDDQIRLARLARQLSNRGCHVIVSNADHTSIRDLYSGFKVETIKRNSVIAASSDNRRSITECIFHNRT